tara:strand:- start:232 stop:411 length:180 start_codon:yes stop_codon:yes gene_type:complete
MKFQEAVVKSIKSYMDGKIPEELEKVTGEPMLYTLEYFDELEKELEIDDPEIKEVEDDA